MIWKTVPAQIGSWILLLLVLSLLPGQVSAQEIIEPAEPESAAPDDLTSRSLESRAELDAIGQSLEKAGDVSALAPLIEALRQRKDEVLPAELDLENPDLDDVVLGDIRSQTGSLIEELADASELLADEAEALEALLGRIKELTDRWLPETLEDYVIPPAMEEQIQGILEEIARLEAAAGDKLNEVASRLNTVYELSDTLTDTVRKLEIYDQGFQSRLLVTNAAPVWSIRFGQLRESVLRTPVIFMRNLRRETTRVIADNVRDLVAHLLLLPLLLLGVAALKKRSDQQRSNALQRPYATAILVWLLLGLVLYQDASVVMRTLIGVLAALSALSVLTSFLPPGLRPGVYTLVALYVTERLLFSAPAADAFPRLVLLGLGIGMLSLAWLASRGRPLEALSQHGMPRAVMKVATVAAVTLSFFGCVAGILGYTLLAKLLIGGVIRSAGLYLIFFTSLTTLTNLLEIIIGLSVLDRLRTLSRHRNQLQRSVRKPLRILALGGWIWGTLVIFDVDTITFDLLLSIIDAELSVGQITLSLAGVLVFVLAVWLALWTSRVVRAVLNEDVLPRMALPRGVPNTISTSIHYLIIVVGVMLGVSFMGIDLSNLAFIVGALGVGIGFGMQNIVNNFISGLILIFERPIQVGDTVEVGALLGKVTNIGIRTSRVRTYGGSEVIVPNGDLASNQVINWTLSDRRRRLELVVGVSYGTDTQKVTDILRGIVEADENVLDDPSPTVAFEEFGDSSLNFRVYVWIADFEGGISARHNLMSAIDSAFAEAGIEIPFPQRDLHLKDVPPELRSG